MKGTDLSKAADRTPAREESSFAEKGKQKGSGSVWREICGTTDLLSTTCERATSP